MNQGIYLFIYICIYVSILGSHYVSMNSNWGRFGKHRLCGHAC